jgi:hypothetical protein
MDMVDDRATQSIKVALGYASQKTFFSEIRLLSVREGAANVFNVKLALSPSVQDIAKMISEASVDGVKEVRQFWSEPLVLNVTVAANAVIAEDWENFDLD